MRPKSQRGLISETLVAATPHPTRYGFPCGCLRQAKQWPEALEMLLSLKHTFLRADDVAFNTVSVAKDVMCVFVFVDGAPLKKDCAMRNAGEGARER